MSESPSASDSAEQVFLAWLEESESAPGRTFEDLCAAHPDLARQLTETRLAHERALRLLEPLSGEGGLRPAQDTAPVPERYLVRGEIARGGMGRILEAHDPSLRRAIAMKVLRRDSGDPQEGLRRQSRLLAEAQILGQLDHPGVVSIHEMGLDAEGRAYFTMKLVRGHDFGVVIRAHHAGDEDWRLPRAVRVLLQVCEAVAYAHTKGVIHRDLKPANIMVGRFGEVFVMDWGLAKVLGRPQAAPIPVQSSLVIGEPAARTSGTAAPERGSTAEHSLVHTDRESGSGGGPAAPVETLAGSLVGTPPYMAPEQARGEPGDARADVYSLGAILYHLLASTHPYARKPAPSSRELVEAVKAGPPQPLCRLARRAPEELVSVCEKAMAREPGQRYAGMRELAEDLRAWLEGRVVRAHRTGAWAELHKWIGRNRGAAAAVACAILALVAIAVQQYLARRDLERAQRETAARMQELRREDYANRVAMASTALASGDIGHMRQLLQDCPRELRGWEWRHLWHEADTSLATLSAGEMDLKTVLPLDGGRSLLAAGSGSPHRILELDLASGERRHEVALPEGHAINNVSVSADGGLLAAFTYLGELRLWELPAWTPRPPLPAALHGWQGAVFAPRGRRLAAFGTEGVQLWDAGEAELLAELSAGQRDIADVAWSPDGNRLYAGSWDGSISVWDAPPDAPLPGKPVRVLRESSQRMQEVEASPDGRWLAGGDWDSRVLIWDARTLELVHRSDRVGGHVWALAWSPDSRLLAVGGMAAVVRLIEAGSWQRLGRLVGHGATVRTLRFGADGSRLYSGCALGEVRTWDLTASTWRTTYVAGARDTPAGIACASDGRRAAVAWRDGLVEIWDLRERRVERAFELSRPLRHVDWSPDGGELAIACWERDVVALDVASGAERARFEVLEPTEVHFDPRGWRLACTANDGGLRVWSLPDGALLSEARVHLDRRGWPGNLFGASWSPDGRELVVCTLDGRIEVRDAASGALLRWTRRPGMVFGSFARDGGSILAAAYAGNGGMERLDAAALAPRWTCLRTSHVWPVLAADGERIFSATWQGTLGVWDGGTGELLAELEGLPPGNPRVGVTPDGRSVVLAAGKHLAFFDSPRP